MYALHVTLFRLAKFGEASYHAFTCYVLAELIVGAAISEID